MTDRPEGTSEHDDMPDDLPDDIEAEPALVVEDDELDLDEEELDLAGDGEVPAADEEISDEELSAPDADVDLQPEPEPEVDVDDEPLDDAVVDDEPLDDAVVDDEPVDDAVVEHDDAERMYVAPAHEPEPLDDDGGAPPEEPVADGKPRRRWGRRLLLGLVLVLGALYVAGYFLTGTRLPADASIGGVDVSGQSPSQARTALERELTARQADEIVLTHDGKEFRMKPAAAGLALDVERSVEAAGGVRSWNPADMIGLFLGSHPTDPVLDVDDALLDGFVGSIAESVDVEVVEAQITFPKGKPAARKPVPGLVVARADAAEAAKKAYFVSKKPVEVPTAIVEPAVDEEGLAEAMTSIAEPAVSAPVTIRVGDKDVELPVGAYSPALVVRVQDNRMQPYLDPKKLAKPLTDTTTGIGKKAVDATVVIEGGKPVVKPGKEGVGLQPEEMATKLVPVLTKTGDERAVEVTAKVVEPDFTTEDAKALKITERVSSFETKFPYAEYRNVNQGRGAELINGTILEPGETFSFNDTVGERTEANGFTSGTVINGGVFREELGGGVSQVVTTTYNAAFFAGLEDVEHHPHAFYIDRYPVGREATVYYGSLDLRFKNPTDYGVLIRAWVEPSTPSRPGEMHVEMWSTKVWDIKAGKSERRNFRSPGTQYDDTPQCVPQGPIQGFDIDIYRTFYQGGKKVKTETDTANYQAADHVICGKKPKAKDGED